MGSQCAFPPYHNQVSGSVGHVIERFASSYSSVNQPLVMQLARCEYIEGREKVIAIGNSGTGVNAQGQREMLGMDVVPGGDQDGML